MKPSTKGVLLSGLVFPGLGQLSLGRKSMGIGIMLLTFLGMAGLVFGLAKRLPPLLDMITREAMQGTMGMDRIMELSVRTAAAGDWWLEQASLYLILFCWVFSILHAFIIGQGLEKAAQRTNP